MSDYLLSNFRQLATENADFLKNIQLADEDVLTRVEDKRVRLTNLSKAISLSKSKKFNTFLTIKDVTGQLHKYNINITGYDLDFVYTDNGYQIPIKAIFSIDFL